MAKTGGVDQLADLLHSGLHQGRPGADAHEKVIAAETLLANHRDNVELLLNYAERMSRSFVPSARQIACVLAEHLWREHPALTPAVLRLATDEDWEVRDWAAGIFQTLLATDFPAGAARIRELLDHPHAAVKRQIALAIRETALQYRNVSGGIDLLLELTEGLLGEESDYVRRTLGPSCIGDGLLRVCPQETLKAMKRWRERPEWAARWNVAMAFSGAQGKQHVEAAWEILSGLAVDERKEVRSAVRKASRNILKRLPDQERFASLRCFIDL